MAQVDGVLRPGAAPGQPCIFKLVLLGSGSVGKSSLAVRYVKNDFKSILPTVGCAFFTKVVDLGAACLKFEIWDTAGQEKYHSVCRLYFRGANAALLVYDITRKDSFCKVQQWLKDLEEEFHPGEVVVMLVGNKTDLGEEREVTFEVQEGANPHLFARKLARSRGLRRCSSSVKRLRAEKVLREEGKEFAESKGLLFMETSAKQNYQVAEVFNAVARELLRREESKEGQRQWRDAPLTLSERPLRPGRCCAH
ncbi:ras-related protein Rab-17 isoform X2 [Budorcas taxicolor]|uniref:ras-related protein Rab-17 isoform X2 n=1 Tax=Budorcas taxicolor TaxID=37181 RepID=UPI002284D8E7|nr:ras-related protein Rab-17 isoform X2 [Budorcas taxicolor]